MNTANDVEARRSDLRSEHVRALDEVDKERIAFDASERDLREAQARAAYSDASDAWANLQDAERAHARAKVRLIARLERVEVLTRQLAEEDQAVIAAREHDAAARVVQLDAAIEAARDEVRALAPTVARARDKLRSLHLTRNEAERERAAHAEALGTCSEACVFGACWFTGAGQRPCDRCPYRVPSDPMTDLQIAIQKETSNA